MRKHLFSFIAAALLCAGGGVTSAFAEEFGLKLASQSDAIFTVVNTNTDAATVVESDGSSLGHGAKTMYFSGNGSDNKLNSAVCYKTLTASTSKISDAYLGFKVSMADGQLLSISGISLEVGVDNNYTWQIEILNADGEELYNSGAKTITNYKDASNVTNTTAEFTGLSSNSKIQNLGGDVYVRLYFWIGSTGKYLTLGNFTITGTVAEGQAATPTCKDVTFAQNSQFDFEKKAYMVTLSTTTPDATIYYTTSTVDGAELSSTCKSGETVAIDGTTVITAKATRDEYNDSEVATSSEFTAPYTFDTSKPYIAWVYSAVYSTNDYDFTKDPLASALSESYNVVPVGISSESAQWSAECATLNQADLVVITEAMQGNDALCISLKSLADGTLPVVNMKAYGYTSGRWGWGTPGAPSPATGVVTPAYSNFYLFDGVKFEEDGTINLTNSEASGTQVQTVSGLGSAVPGIPVTIATCGDGIAIYASTNYLFFGLSSASYLYYNDNAATILKNAVTRLLNNEDLTAMDASKATVCVDPQASLSEIDMSTYTYQLTLTSLDESSLYYKRSGDADYKLYTESISLKRNEVVTAIAKDDTGKKTQSNVITVTAPDNATTGSETAAACSSGNWTGTCFTITIGHIAGKSNSSAVTGAKVRVNQALASSKAQGFTINVNEGYIINKVEMTGISNYNEAIKITDIYSDGEKTDYENYVFNSNDSGSEILTYTFEVNAKKSIEFASNLGSEENQNATQINVGFKFYYTIPSDPETIHTVEFNNAVEGFATFCPSKTVAIPEGVEAYIAKEENNALTLTALKKAIPAGTGVILRGEAGKSVEFETTGFTADVTGNELVGTTEATTVEAKSVYVLSTTEEEGVQFYLYGGTSIAANKAYLPKSVASSISALRFNFGTTEEPGNVTGINNVTIENNGEKVIYNLRGQRVLSLERPGLYIVNGKKIVVK